MKVVFTCLIITIANVTWFTHTNNQDLLNKWKGRIDYTCRDSSTQQSINKRKNVVQYEFKNDLCIIDDITIITGYSPSTNHVEVKYKVEGDSIIWESNMIGANVHFEFKGDDSLFLKGFDKGAECYSFAYLKKQ